MKLIKEAKEAVDSLYDFLYKDKARISSYYAQIFRGTLTSIQTNHADGGSLEKKNQFGSKGTHAAKSTLSENSDSITKSIDPNDLLTTDILSFLMENGFIYEDFDKARSGNIVIVKGALSLVGKAFLECAFQSTIDLWQHISHQEAGISSNKEKQALIKKVKALGKVFSNMPFSPFLHLKTEEGLEITGTIKEEGLEDVISSFSIKHGSKALTDIYVIGIKEIGKDTPTISSGELLVASNEFADTLRTLIYPSDAVPITPIAIFRKL